MCVCGLAQEKRVHLRTENRLDLSFATGGSDPSFKYHMCGKRVAKIAPEFTGVGAEVRCAAQAARVGMIAAGN